MPERIDTSKLARELHEWIATSPSAGAMLYLDEQFPSLESLEKLSNQAYKLQDLIAEFDEELGGRSIVEVRKKKRVLLDLCDALDAVWNAADPENDDGLILEECEVNGYGHDPATQEVAENFLIVRQELEAVGKSLRFTPDHWCNDCWVWTVGGGEVLAWWARRDELDELAEKVLPTLPSHTMLWSAARDQLDAMLRDGIPAEFNRVCCDALESQHGTEKPSALQLSRKAIAVEWARRRWKLPTPPANAFTDGPEHFDWYATDFENASDKWPVINDAVDECGRNIASYVRVSFEHLRDVIGDKESPQVGWSEFEPISFWEREVFHQSWDTVIRKMKREGVRYEKMPKRWLYRIELKALPPSYVAAIGKKSE